MSIDDLPDWLDGGEAPEVNPEAGHARARARTGVDVLDAVPSEAGKKFVERVRKLTDIQRITVARTLAEGASIIGAPLVATVVVDTSLNEPYQNLKDRIASKVVLPNFERFDTFLSHAQSFETPDKRAERKAKPIEEQARDITNLLVDQFGLKGIGGIGGQFFTQDYLNHKFNVPNLGKRETAISMVADKAVMLGGMVVLNTGLAKQSIAMQNGLEKMLRGFGMQEDKAQEWANYAININVPNLLGLATSVGVLLAYARGGGKLGK